MIVIAALFSAPPPATAADATATETPNCADASVWTKTDGLVKEAHPVVLVHGWTGNALSDLRTQLERKAGSGWQFLLFDYHNASTQWAASPDIAGCLIQYLKTVSKTQTDGLVYVVAHSMGGLATLFAAQDTSLKNRIGGLVSIATPYGGSPWGNSRLGPISYGKFKEISAGLGFKDIPPYAAAARTCLAVHDGTQGLPDGCKLAPYLPTDIAIHEIGGLLTVKRTFFGLHAYDMPMGGDTVVPLGSSLGYLGSAGKPSPGGIKVGLDSVDCTMDAAALIAKVGSRNIFTALPSVWSQMLSDTSALDAVLADKASPALLELMAAANFYGTCSHSGLLTNSVVVTDIVKALNDQVAWQTLRRNAHADGVPVMTPSAFGPLKLGMTAPQLDVTPQVKKGANSGSCHVYEWASPAGTALAYIPREGTSVVAILPPAGAKTDRGVGSGSTAAQLKAAYPTGYTISDMAGQGMPGVTIIPVGTPTAKMWVDPVPLLSFVIGEDGRLAYPSIGIPSGSELCMGMPIGEE